MVVEDLEEGLWTKVFLRPEKKKKKRNARHGMTRQVFSSAGRRLDCKWIGMGTEIY